MEALAASVLFDDSDPARLTREEVEASHGSALAFFESMGLRPSSRQDIDAALAESRRRSSEAAIRVMQELAVHRLEQQAQEAAEAGAEGTPIKCSDPDQSFPEPEPFTPPAPAASPLAAVHRCPPPPDVRPPRKWPRWVKAGLALILFYLLVFGTWYFHFGGDRSIADYLKKRQMTLNRALLEVCVCARVCVVVLPGPRFHVF